MYACTDLVCYFLNMLHALLTVTQIGIECMQYLKCVYVSLAVKMMDGLAIVTA